MVLHHLYREAGIWTPVNESKDDPVPTYNYSDNGLTYVGTIFHACIRVHGGAHMNIVSIIDTSRKPSILENTLGVSPLRLSNRMWPKGGVLISGIVFILLSIAAWDP